MLCADNNSLIDPRHSVCPTEKKKQIHSGGTRVRMGPMRMHVHHDSTVTFCIRNRAEAAFRTGSVASAVKMRVVVPGKLDTVG